MIFSETKFIKYLVEQGYTIIKELKRGRNNETLY